MVYAECSGHSVIPFLIAAMRAYASLCQKCIVLTEGQTSEVKVHVVRTS
jgi:hypothetical protein